MCVGCVAVRSRGCLREWRSDHGHTMDTGALENIEDVIFRTGFPKAVLWTSSLHNPCVSWQPEAPLGGGASLQEETIADGRHRILPLRSSNSVPGTVPYIAAD